MTVLARREDGLEIDDDPARFDLEVTYDLVVNQAYWAKERTRELVARTIEASWSFGAYDGSGRQVGFARVVTDRLTFAWVCDVVVDEPLRGKGIGRFLMRVVTDAVSGTIDGWQVLRTRDAHALYRDLGWTDLVEADRWMEIRP
ncbi:MAG TPA: GNAT family N-acetyltransferase [Candidatus Nanopelagicales bacterium]|nr:GNAT family N-acetyltransferase [Candidatus Nanopelagicales bacterium]